MMATPARSAAPESNDEVDATWDVYPDAEPTMKGGFYENEACAIIPAIMTTAEHLGIATSPIPPKTLAQCQLTRMRDAPGTSRRRPKFRLVLQGADGRNFCLFESKRRVEGKRVWYDIHIPPLDRPSPTLARMVKKPRTKEWELIDYQAAQCSDAFIEAVTATRPSYDCAAAVAEGRDDAAPRRSPDAVVLWALVRRLCRYEPDIIDSIESMVTLRSSQPTTVEYTHPKGEPWFVDAKLPFPFRAVPSAPPGPPVQLVNKKPRWNAAGAMYSMRFYGRANVSSIKNFQLTAADSSRKHPTVLLLMGKVSDNVFNLDFRGPFTPLQAFAFALSTFEI